MHKTHIFDQKNNAKNYFFTNLPTLFFLDRYRKQTISFFRAYSQVEECISAILDKGNNEKRNAKVSTYDYYVDINGKTSVHMPGS